MPTALMAFVASKRLINSLQVTIFHILPISWESYNHTPVRELTPFEELAYQLTELTPVAAKPY